MENVRIENFYCDILSDFQNTVQNKPFKKITTGGTKLKEFDQFFVLEIFH